MLKQLDSAYQVGRKKGGWWKWKIDPLIVDAVMIYAQQGHGRRANLFTDYTFAAWQGDDLIPFAKAYSGLTDKEFQEITKFVRANTLERFGPVRSVKPHLVFEIAFEGIRRSKRHKSGIALRFPEDEAMAQRQTPQRSQYHGRPDENVGNVWGWREPVDDRPKKIRGQACNEGKLLPVIDPYYECT